MRAEGSPHWTSTAAAAAVAVAVAMALLAAACGGSESSGLPTLVGTATTAPVFDPEDIEPVSEPTAAPTTSSVTATTAESRPDPSADTADIEADPTGGAGSASEAPAVAGGEPAEPAVAAEGQAEPEVTAAEPNGSEDLSDEERLLAFAQCMRDNGVDFPDPVVEADGTVTFGFRPGSAGGGPAVLREIGRDPDLPAAREACQGLVEGVAFGSGPGGFDRIEIQDALLEFARCMRDHGVDIGDPDLRAFGPGGSDDDQPGGPFGVIDLDDPDWAAAFEVCQQRLPGAGEGARFGGGG